MKPARGYPLCACELSDFGFSVGSVTKGISSAAKKAGKGLSSAAKKAQKEAERSLRRAPRTGSLLSFGPFDILRATTGILGGGILSPAQEQALLDAGIDPSTVSPARSIPSWLPIAAGAGIFLVALLVSGRRR